MPARHFLLSRPALLDHAIELYLNAYLLHEGMPPEKIRTFLHDLAQRADHADIGALTLRKKTVEHLSTLTTNREYLVSRYAPELVGTHSEGNRLAATLAEIADKVKKQLGEISTRAPSPTADTG